MTTHHVTIEVDDYDEAYSWECNCGIAGTGGSSGYLKAELRNDHHINPDDTRIDVYPAH